MPIGVVKTPEEEKLWEKAKGIAEKSGHKEDWPYIMGIYKKMTGYEKKASADIYLTAADYKEYFEKYAAAAIKDISAKAMKKIKDAPGRFKTDYNFGKPQSFWGKVIDTAKGGGYKRGNAALDYARFGSAEGTWEKPNLLAKDLEAIGVPKATIEKLSPIRKDSFRVRQEFENIQKKLDKVTNKDGRFIYSDGVDYDSIRSPEKLVRTYYQHHGGLPKDSIDEVIVNKNGEKVNPFKLNFHSNFSKVQNALNQEKKNKVNEIQKNLPSIKKEKAMIDQELAEIKKARDNELAKTLGLWSIPTTGLALGGKAVYNKHNERKSNTLR